MNNPILRAIVFFLRRLLGNLGSLLVVVTLLFLLLFAGPAGLSAIVVPSSARAQFEQQYGLDQPLPAQYVSFMGRALTGDFGDSIMSRQRSVAELTGDYMPNTLRLWGAAVLFSLVPALVILGLGLLVLWLRGRVPVLGNGLRRLGQWIASGWLLVPALATGLVLWVFLAVQMRIFPVSGMYNVRTGESLDQVLQHIFLPALSLSILPAYLVARSVAGELAHYAGQRNAHPAAVIGHAVARFLADGLVQGIGILGGLVLIETLFNWPGIGRLLLQATQARDIPVVLGVLMNVLWLALALRVLGDLFRAVSLIFSAWLDSKVEEPEPRPKPRSERTLGIVWVVIPVLLVLVPLLVGLGGAFVAPHDPMAQSVGERMAPPGGEYLLGTDMLGRDVFSRLLYAMRLDLGMALLMTIVAAVPAVLGGLLAGFLARRRTVWADLLDGLVMFPAEALVALPGFMLLTAAAGTWWSMAQDAPVSWLPMMFFAVLLYVLPRTTRMVREGTAVVSTQGGTGRAGLRLLGVVGAALLVAPTLGLLASLAMGYLGMGTPPPEATLGGVIQENIRSAITLLATQGLPWSILLPILAFVFLSGGWFLLAETVLSWAGVHKRESWLDVNR